MEVTAEQQRQRHSELNQNWARHNRDKANAHNATYRARKSGVLKQEPCEVCGAENTHAHHEDYTKPLEVRWLCPSHHRQRHIELGRDAVPRPDEGRTPKPPAAERTHCPHGHEYDEENTIHRNGQRFCRECHRLRSIARNAAQKPRKFCRVCETEITHIPKQKKLCGSAECQQEWWRKAKREQKERANA